MVDIVWHTETRLVKELIEWPRNPRRITHQRMEQLKTSLKKFGYADPVIANVDNQLIAGHMRLKAMALLKMVKPETPVDVRLPSRRLSKEEADELAVRHNGKFGDWNFDILTADFSMGQLMDFGFSNVELGLDFGDASASVGKEEASEKSDENNDDNRDDDKAGSGHADSDDGDSMDESESQSKKDYSLQVLCESEADQNKVIALCHAYKIRFIEGR